MSLLIKYVNLLHNNICLQFRIYVIMKIAIYSRKSVFTGKEESIENKYQL